MLEKFIQDFQDQVLVNIIPILLTTQTNLLRN